MTATGRTQTIRRRAGDGPSRLSFPQERLFLLDRLTPGLAAYNVPTLVRVGTTLDAKLLGDALDRVVARHEILRTSVGLSDGVPVQTVSADGHAELSVADFRSEPETERAGRAQDFLGGLANRPFRLDGDVLLRAGLAHVQPDEDLLLIVLHHMASDHTSAALLFAELDIAYRALDAGQEPELPELPVQYSDYAEWQREHCSGETLDELLSYWTAQLAGAPERLEFPTDRPRPSVQSYRGRLREFTIPATDAAPLRELARAHGVSMFMLLQAAFKTLLQRYTGSDDIVVGAPVAGRHYEEILPLLGFFSNTLTLRTDLSGDPTFAELLQRVRTTTLEAQIYQELPFEKLIETINPERAQSHSPLFQVMLGFDVAPAQSPMLAGCVLEQLPVPGWQWARFDLSLVLRDQQDGSLHSHLEYATDLFDSTTIERFIGHLRTLLAAIARDPEQRLSELSILTSEERRALLVDWNDTARPYETRCVHELFAEQARRAPDRVGVISAEGRYTYGELERRSNQLAHELRSADVGPGTLVGICLERGLEMVVALLAVLKSGAAYVPIDPSFPPARQEFMLEDANAPVLLTQALLAGTLNARGARVICVDTDWDAIAKHSTEPPAAVPEPEHLAYVIYTSGSTGRPKGVEISHRALVNFLIAMRERPGLTQDDILLAVTTLSFDIAGLELYLPLIVGARVVITPSEATMDGVDLADWLARSGATFVQATPTTWQLLVEAGWKGSESLTIACGGEALSRSLADQLLERSRSVWQMYGPTETTIWSSVTSLEAGEGAPPLGGPIANTTFYVLDRDRQPVPIGVPGELHIGGDGLAAGYHNRPELTAEKFVVDPFGGAGGRLYRTGDLVSWTAAGALEFHGRIDQQIKLRGFRIELGEIEAVLAGHDDVNRAAAIVREDRPGDQRLVAYVTAAEAKAPELDSLRKLVKSKLPPFMVPSTIVVLDSLPVTPNGKLDRKSLPAPDGTRPELAHSYAPPETPIEEQLAEIWSEVLGLERVGIDDDFFDLGGHSLLAVRMLARVQELLGVDLYLGQVFDNSTIRSLAASVAEELMSDTSEADLAELLAEAEAGSLLGDSGGT